MSTLSIAYGRPTLADRIFSRGLVTDIILIAAGTALTSILAQIAIPLWPVPITGQTFSVLFVGATLVLGLSLLCPAWAGFERGWPGEIVVAVCGTSAVFWLCVAPP